MSSGFRGTQIQITEISIKARSSAGAVLQYKCLFVDEEGTAHGQVTHEIEASSELFAELTQSLVAACRTHATNTHFAEPDTEDKKVVIRGISEALQRATDTSDRVGESG